MSFKFAFWLLAIFLCTAQVCSAEDGSDVDSGGSNPLWSAWERAKSAWNNLQNSNHGEGWEDVKATLSHLGSFFKGKFDDAREFYADNKDDLEPKVRSTMQFLNSIRQKIEDFDRKADPAFQSVISKVKKWMGITQDMEMRIENGEEDREELRKEWKAQAQKMYSEGLGKVVTFAKAEALTDKNGSSSVKTSFAILLLSMSLGLFVFW